MKYCLILSLLVGLSACGNDSSSNKVPIEIVSQKPWQEELVADGEIVAAASTQLSVPGDGWDQRMLISMVANGSLVEKGQLIATFDSKQARVRLSQAEVDLLRKELSEIGSKAVAEIGRAELTSEGAKVESDLSLSKRYANADLGIFKRNDILDMLADIGYLGSKQQYLKWKHNQIGARSKAEQGLIGSQKESVSLIIDQQRRSLSALALLAPHAGVFILKANWSGSLPQIGGQLYVGEDFGSLPDLEQQVASFSVPEGAAFGLKEGQDVKVRLVGTGNELNLKVTNVGTTATTKSQESPVKYAEFEAKFDQEAVRKFKLKPGQAISGKVILLNVASAITVPNIALVQEGNDYFVFVKEGSKQVKRKVVLGIRGPVRSEVKTGLSVGMQLVLVPEKKESKS